MISTNSILESPSTVISQQEAVASQFSRAAHSYDIHAQVQLGVARSLLAWLSPKDDVGVAADLGAGTAPMAWQQRRLRPNYHWWAVDFSQAMLDEAQDRGRFASQYQGLCANVARLPFADASLQLLYSSFALQWCDDIASVGAELFRVAAPGAELLLAVPVQGTLRELSQCWAQVSEAQHVNHLARSQHWCQALSQAGWLLEDMAEQQIVEHYPTVRAVLEQLKYTGANHVLERGSGLMGKQRWQQFTQAYEALRQDAGVPMTWRVLMLRLVRGEAC